MEERCGNYCGVECINGYCPKALRDEYMERDYAIVHNCGECGYYRGCEDCYFADKPDLCEPRFVKYRTNKGNEKRKYLEMHKNGLIQRKIEKDVKSPLESGNKEKRDTLQRQRFQGQ